MGVYNGAVSGKGRGRPDSSWLMAICGSLLVAFDGKAVRLAFVTRTLRNGCARLDVPL